MQLQFYGICKLDLHQNKEMLTYQDPSSTASRWEDQNLMADLLEYNMAAQL